MPNTDYRSISYAEGVAGASPKHKAIILGLWLLTLALSIGLGLASIVNEWSGIPIPFGGLDVSVTIYPPLIFCVFWVLWMGFWWGFIPAYLSTLVLALFSGMPLGWSLLFAFADPLGLAVLAVTYRAIPVSYRLHTLNSLLVFIGLSFVSGIMGSTGSFIWSYTNQIAAPDVFPVWQGWWLGAFLQNLLFVAPILYLFSGEVVKWRDRHFQVDESPAELSYLEVVSMGLIIIFGIMVYLYASIKLGGLRLDFALARGDAEQIAYAARVFSDSTEALFWGVGAILFFFSFFGYQLFNYWTRSLRHSAQKLKAANTELEHLSQVDSLTGLYNRRAWEILVENEFKRAFRCDEVSAVLLLDIDHFKRINDTYGHQAGDAVIRSVAADIRRTKRDSDVAGRYGGEEFLIVMPDTGEEGAYLFAERLRKQIQHTPVNYNGHSLSLTACVGVATISTGQLDYHAWVGQADRALYQAKLEGRNRSVIYGGYSNSCSLEPSS